MFAYATLDYPQKKLKSAIVNFFYEWVVADRWEIFCWEGLLNCLAISFLCMYVNLKKLITIYNSLFQLIISSCFCLTGISWNQKFQNNLNTNACIFGGWHRMLPHSHLKAKHIPNQYIEKDLSETFVLAPNIVSIWLLQTSGSCLAEVSNR